MDSISDLAKAVLEILSGEQVAKVYWNGEPVIHNFVFTAQNDECSFKVNEVFALIVGENLIEKFSFVSFKHEVLRPFWKALSDMKSKKSLEEYERQWSNPFPLNELIEIKQKLKDIKR